MGTIICALPNGNYLEWSTVTDSPITYGVPRAHFDHYMRRQYGQKYYEEEHERRMMFANKHGTSSRAPKPTSFEELAKGNHAGPKGKELSFPEILTEFGQLPESYLTKSENYFDEPDGFHVIDAETHELVGHFSNEILTWGYAQKVKSRHADIQCIIVAKTFKEVSEALKPGEKVALRDGLYD